MDRTDKKTPADSRMKSSSYSMQPFQALHVLALLLAIPTNVLSAPSPSSQLAPESQLGPKLQATYQFNKQMPAYLQLHKLNHSGNNVTCNDGSPIGYYKRLNSHSKSWIIYLQGGGFCSSEQSCRLRWQQSPHLMSSSYWPQSKTMEGILSSEPNENPYLWNANHIYVPYCSSDSWTGLSGSNIQQLGDQNQHQFVFMGSKIVEQIFESLYEDLPRDSSLHEAKFILLAGDSAGATGVMLNLDRVNSIVERKTDSARANCSPNSDQISCEPKTATVLRGLADSGWFLDNEPYDFARFGDLGPDERQPESSDDCDQTRCTPLQSIRQAMRLWNGQVPDACAARHPLEPWRCYFGYRTYQTLRTPLFVVQWLYDEAQLMADNIGRPDTNDQWSYVNKLVAEMRSSLENVTALFAPSCFSHSLVIRNNWNRININGLKLPHVLNSWEEQSILDSIATPAQAAPPIVAIASPPPVKTVNNLLDFSKFLRSHTNESAPSVGYKQTFVAALADQEGLVASGSMSSNNQPMIAQAALMQDTRQISQRPTGSFPRPRGRKRKRNNQQQQSHRLRHGRQRSATHPIGPFESHSALGESTPLAATSRDSNDLSSSANPLQDLLPLIDRALATSASLDNGRLGRSTIVDDSTPMLSNNVPEDSNSNSPTVSKHLNADRGRFRFIDSCGWPQCNRDCPAVNSDLSQASLIQLSV